MIKNQKAGGSDWNTPDDRVKPTDLNETFDRFANALVESTVTFLEGINFNTELAQNNSITDKSYTYASTDIFTDSGGYNDTVDTGNTTAIYESDNDEYICDFSDEASGDTTHDPNNVSNPSNAFDNDDNTYAEINPTGSLGQSASGSLGKTFNSKYVHAIKYKVRVQAQSSSQTNPRLARVESYDGNSWNTEYTIVDDDGGDTTFTNESLFIGKNVQGIRIYLSANAPQDDGNANLRWFTIEYGSAEDSIIQINSNTFSNIANASSFLLTAENNGSGSLGVDISSDGGSNYEKTGQNIKEVIELDGDNNQIEAKINLTPSASGESPRVPGYAYQVWEN